MAGVGRVLLTRITPLAALKKGETEAFKVPLLKGKQDFDKSDIYYGFQS